MALVLINIGFKPDHVYYRMGMAEFNLHFITAMKVIKRAQQMQSATFMGSIGSFFVKKGQKTIIETLGEEIKMFDLMVGGKKKAVDSRKIFNNFMEGFKGLRK